MRALTTNERAVLAHVVMDPDAWWTHVSSDGKRKLDAEKCLSGKVDKYQSEYDTALAAGNYQTRAQKEAE